MNILHNYAKHARLSIINNSFEQFKKQLKIVKHANLLNNFIPWGSQHEERALVDWLLHESAKYQRLEFVKILIPLSDPKCSDSRALQFALAQNNQPLIDVLLPHSDAGCANSLLLQMAMIHDNQYMLHTYIDQCDPQSACQGLIKRGFTDLAEQLDQFATARATKRAINAHISENISDASMTKPTKKI